MGNRNATRDGIAIINPSEAPYLHVIGNKEQGYHYVPTLSGMRVTFSSQQLHPRDFAYDQSVAEVEIPLLPRVEMSQHPDPIESNMHLDNVLQHEHKKIISLIDSKKNGILGFHYGSLWGELPIEHTLHYLGLHRFYLDGSIAVVGRKRYQRFVIPIARK